MSELKPLEWRDGAPTDMHDHDAPCVLDLGNGDYVVFGHVNLAGGQCDCCGHHWEVGDVVRWAPLAFAFDGVAPMATALAAPDPDAQRLDPWTAWVLKQKRSRHE